MANATTTSSAEKQNIEKIIDFLKSSKNEDFFPVEAGKKFCEENEISTRILGKTINIFGYTRSLKKTIETIEKILKNDEDFFSYREKQEKIMIDNIHEKNAEELLKILQKEENQYGAMGKERWWLHGFNTEEAEEFLNSMSRDCARKTVFAFLSIFMCVPGNPNCGYSICSRFSEYSVDFGKRMKRKFKK